MLVENISLFIIDIMREVFKTDSICSVLEDFSVYKR